MLNKKKLGLKDVIQDCIENVYVDLFGIEQQVIKNINDYLNEMTFSSQAERKGLNVRICYNPDKLLVELLSYAKPIKELKIEELVKFFTGELKPELQETITTKVTAYLIQLSESHKIPERQINVRINSPKEDVVKVMLYNSNAFHADLSIKAIIKFFK